LTDPAIEIDGLTKRYRRGGRPALDRIHLAIPAGSIAAFVGPNGAGKTTLIRCLLGFERPTAGGARVMGIDPARDRTAALLQTGYVGQSPGLYRDLSSNDHIALAAALRRGFDEAGARGRLDALGIERFLPARELSGGQQAQLSLALALGTRAPVLLLDEPLASLDPLARRDFLRVLGDAARADGSTVLLASHIVGDIAAVCDRLIVLAPARVMLSTTIADARARHAVVPLDAATASDIIGTFDDASGRPQALVRITRASAGLEPASLDDIVLGYFAAARTDGSTSDRGAAA
jgi:ABC-2 type transport system ATP-binding protein